MIKDKIYKLYFLKDPRNDEIRYVGITGQQLRERLSNHLKTEQNTHKSNWIKQLKKENLKPEIIEFANSFDRDYIIALEIFLIKEFKNLGFLLTNLSPGGEGSPWEYMTEEQKKKSSEATTLRNKTNNPAKSPEARRKMSENNAMNREECYQNLLLAKEKDKKIVIQFDLLGNRINEYKGIRHAERMTGVDHSAITRCCTGRNIRAGNYIWKFKDSENLEEELKFALSNMDVDYMQRTFSRPVIQLDKNGIIVAKFSSANEAKAKTGICNIGMCCKGFFKQCGGYLWRYEEN